MLSHNTVFATCIKIDRPEQTVYTQMAWTPQNLGSHQDLHCLPLIHAFYTQHQVVNLLVQILEQVW